MTTTAQNKINNLVVKNLRLDYKTNTKTIHAVKNVSFNIKSGEALGIVGESGCGKTSIALSLLRLFPKNVSKFGGSISCLLYTSPRPRDATLSRMPSSA